MNREFPQLHDFFGAYFHQDWTVEHDEAEQVVDAFVGDCGAEDLMLVREELGRLLEQRKDEMELREFLLQELSCYYCYWNEWKSGEVWLLHIATKVGNGM